MLCGFVEPRGLIQCRTGRTLLPNPLLGVLFHWLGGLASASFYGHGVAHDISAFSFAALAKALKLLMSGRSASMLALTYVGSQRAKSMYNVMGPAKASLEANVRYMAMDLGIDGIRVNAISAGPIKTPSVAAIAGFDHVQKTTGSAAALKRSVSVDEIGNAAAFFAQTGRAELPARSCGIPHRGAGGRGACRSMRPARRSSAGGEVRRRT